MKIKQLLVSLFVALFMAAGPVWAGDMVDLNTATVTQLQTVTGIGEKTASAIVVYRDKHGAFASVDGLLNVKGIGEKKLAKIRSSIEVNDQDDKGIASH